MRIYCNPLLGAFVLLAHIPGPANQSDQHNIKRLYYIYLRVCGRHLKLIELITSHIVLTTSEGKGFGLKLFLTVNKINLYRHLQQVFCLLHYQSSVKLYGL